MVTYLRSFVRRDLQFRSWPFELNEKENLPVILMLGWNLMMMMMMTTSEIVTLTAVEVD
jgi:hypothetical protein